MLAKTRDNRRNCRLIHMLGLMRALALVAILLSACDTLNIQQYRVAGGAHRDASKVKRVLHDVANQTGLVDRTPLPSRADSRVLRSRTFSTFASISARAHSETISSLT